MAEHGSPTIRITEIFCSIQGESTRSGLRTSFVRTTGCPLRCTYCDSKYSYHGGESKSVNDILHAIEQHQTDYVCITGGEPLAQKNLPALVKELKRLNKKISIETDGEEDVSRYVGVAKIIMDIKTPGSGETARNCFQNLSHLVSSDEIKFVLCSRDDYEWASGICRQYDLTRRFTVLFSPAHGQLTLAALAEWILADRLDVRLQDQLHKTIWGAQASAGR